MPRRQVGRALTRTIAVTTMLGVALGSLPTLALAQDAQTPVIIVQESPPPQPAPAPYVYSQQQPYQPYAAAPQPVQAEPPRRRNRTNLGLIISGAVLLGVGWLLDIVISLPAGDDPFVSGGSEGWDDFRIVSVIPVIGPWIQIAVKPTSFSEDYWAVWLIADGLIQTAGLVMLIAGIATSGGDEEAPLSGREGDVRWSLAPMVSPQQTGLAASLTF